MPYPTWPWPFSSVDIPDDDWNRAVAQWRAAQGAYDPVANRPLDDVDAGAAFDPASLQASAQLASARMPHDQWQKARMMQLATRDKGDGGDTISGDDGPETPEGASSASPGGGDDAQAQQFAAFKTLMASPDEEGRRNDVYRDSLGKPT
ncbi:MAG TPA: hypothetical protein VHV47_15385, partial [Opitutaceae bacterium]|nr:hypothetical protein [Opitutaceae bacterium]